MNLSKHKVSFWHFDSKYSIELSIFFMKEEPEQLFLPTDIKFLETSGLVFTSESTFSFYEAIESLGFVMQRGFDKTKLNLLMEYLKCDLVF